MRDLQEKSTFLSSLNENLIREVKYSTVNDPKKASISKRRVRLVGAVVVGD